MQRSEAGRIIYSDSRVAFYAMFVDEAVDSNDAVRAISKAGFEIAREFAPATVTTTPFDAFLDDGFVTVARGTSGDDSFRIQRDSSGTGIAIVRNGTTMREFPVFSVPMDTLRVDSGNGADSFLVQNDPTPTAVGKLVLNGGNGADFFDITATTRLPMTLDGGGGEDILRYRGLGTLSGTAEPFTISRSGHQPISFRGMDTYFLPPTISELPDVTVPLKEQYGPVSFTVGDAESNAATLIVTAGVKYASNPRIVPSADAGTVTLGGSGANRTLTFTPPRKFLGPAIITVRVTDETDRTTAMSFRVTPPVQAAAQFSLGSDAGGGSVTLRNADNTPRFTVNPFGDVFAGGVRTAAGDFTGDGIADLVAASGPGMPGQVLVYDGVTQAQIPMPLPGNLAFGESFTRGILVAAGDLNGDGLSDLIITAEAGGGARVRIFQSTGSGFTQRSDFIALIGGDGVPDARVFRGGSRATVSDINGDGTGDLIWAAGAGGGPRVATFDGKRLDQGTNTTIKLSGDFFALSPALRDGCYLAGGDINGDGFGDVVFGGGSGAPPQVVAYSGSFIVDSKFVPFADFQFGVDSRQGIRVAVKDVNDDGLGDVIVASAPGAGSRVAAFDGRNLIGSATGTALFDYEAIPNFSGGVFVG